MKNIDEAIKEKRAAIMRLQEEMETLERARVLLNGGTTHPLTFSETVTLRDSYRVRKGKRLRVHPMRGKVNPKSAIGHAVAVLRDRMNPLHLDEILSGVHKRGGQAKKASLGSSLAKMSKHGQIFYRASQPNTFGLIEWQAVKLTPSTGSLEVKGG